MIDSSSDISVEASAASPPAKTGVQPVHEPAVRFMRGRVGVGCARHERVDGREEDLLFASLMEAQHAPQESEAVGDRPQVTRPARRQPGLHLEEVPPDRAVDVDDVR